MKVFSSVLVFFLLTTLFSCKDLFSSSRNVNSLPPVSTSENIQSIRTVFAKKITIDSLIGLPLPGGSDWSALFVPIDSLVIDLDKISPKNYAIKNGTLSIIGATINSIEVNPSNEEVSIKPPYYIPELQFKKIIIKRGGDNVTIDSLVSYTQGNFHINYYSTVNPKVEEKRTLLNENVGKLYDRLEKIRKKVKELNKKQPDHAADMLNSSLDEIEIKLSEIKKWHKRFTSNLPVLNADLEKLFSIDITFDDMEIRLDSPLEASILETKVLFGSGEYKINDKTQLAPLNKIVDAIIQRAVEIQKERPGRTIVFDLKVTGYADEMDIGTNLAAELEALDNTKKPDSLTIQDHLNVLLSIQRSISVNNYIQKKFDAKFNNSIVKLKTASIGKGRHNYPKHVLSSSCPSDCAQRRVVIISDIAFSED